MTANAFVSVLATGGPNARLTEYVSEGTNQTVLALRFIEMAKDVPVTIDGVRTLTTVPRAALLVNKADGTTEHAGSTLLFQQVIAQKIKEAGPSAWVVGLLTKTQNNAHENGNSFYYDFSAEGISDERLAQAYQAFPAVAPA